MKSVILGLTFAAALLSAQGTLPWGDQAVNVPALATNSNVTVFYVSDYGPSGSHTDYDMARQAADAFVNANPGRSTFLVLKPTANSSCDAAPLPSVSGSSNLPTLSIVGFGSSISTLQKRKGCSPGAATLRHIAPAAGNTNTGWYQGFTVDANHLDSAGCELYGMTSTTFFDVACGNAAPNADHQLEFGQTSTPNGSLNNVHVYHLVTYDTVGVGKGALLTPTWSNGQLTGVTVSNGGTKKYTQQYTRAQLIGPDLATCSSVPTLTPTVSNLSSTTGFQNLPTINYGWVTGATITNGGSCSSTARIYILVQDGIPATYGMKFTNFNNSKIWNLEATGVTNYGEAWLANSSNNTIYGEHPYTNQTIQIAEYAQNNAHYNTLFDSAGYFGAAIYGPSGSFQDTVSVWDGSAYVGSSGFYFGNSSGYSSWTIKNSQCTSSTSYYTSVSTKSGPLANSSTSGPLGVSLKDLEVCDGSIAVNWATLTSY